MNDNQICKIVKDSIDLELLQNDNFLLDIEIIDKICEKYNFFNIKDKIKLYFYSYIEFILEMNYTINYGVK